MCCYWEWHWTTVQISKFTGTIFMGCQFYTCLRAWNIVDFFSQKMKKDYHQFLYLLRIKFGQLENGLFRFLDCSYMKLLPYKYRIFVRIKQLHVNKYCQKQFTCNKWKEDFKSKNHKLSNYMITSIYNHVMDFLVSEK